MKRLIHTYEEFDTSKLEDLMLVTASSIEDSLLQAGAKPGQDYTILDCYKLAQPFALEEYRKKLKDRA